MRRLCGFLCESFPLAPSLYNRHVKRISLLAAALFLAGCSKNIDTTDAVRQGIMDYMNSVAPKIGLDMNSMQVDVTAVTFEQDHARASVSITPKIAGAKGMQLSYNLDRKGDKWVVNGNAQSAGSAHGSQGGAAPATAAPDGTQLPPGHPAVGAPRGGAPGAGAGQLPPGHPPVSGSQTSPGNKP